MNAPLHKHGLFPFRRGEFFVMSDRGADGLLVHAVWELRTHQRWRNTGDAFKVAEFFSKPAARAWARERNAKRFKE